jgi:hypothetical protein
VLVFLKPLVLEFVPYLKELLVKHMGLMDTLDAGAKKGQVLLAEIKETQDAHGKQIDEIHSIVKGKN